MCVYSKLTNELNFQMKRDFIYNETEKRHLKGKVCLYICFQQMLNKKVVLLIFEFVRLN